jgi:hypothetical protein
LPAQTKPVQLRLLRRPTDVSDVAVLNRSLSAESCKCSAEQPAFRPLLSAADANKEAAVARLLRAAQAVEGLLLPADEAALQGWAAETAPAASASDGAAQSSAVDALSKALAHVAALLQGDSAEAHAQAKALAMPALSLVRVLALQPESAARLCPAAFASALDVARAPAVADVRTGLLGVWILALTFLANAFATAEGTRWATSHAAASSGVTERLIEAAVAALAYRRREGAASLSATDRQLARSVRQMGSALAHNLAAFLPLGADAAAADTGGGGSTAAGDATVFVSDSSVQLLCALLDGVDLDLRELGAYPSQLSPWFDMETLSRRLHAAGLLLQREGLEASILMDTLGMAEGLRTLAEGAAADSTRTARVGDGSNKTVAPGDLQSIAALALEVLALVGRTAGEA